MSQQLEHIKKALSKMEPEELEAHIKAIRTEKYIVRPAAKKRAAKAERKETKKQSGKISDLEKGMSPEEIEELKKSMGL